MKMNPREPMNLKSRFKGQVSPGLIDQVNLNPDYARGGFKMGSKSQIERRGKS